jgi:tyrosine-protein phosphatase YwqE
VNQIIVYISNKKKFEDTRGVINRHDVKDSQYSGQEIRIKEQIMVDKTLHKLFFIADINNYLIHFAMIANKILCCSEDDIIKWVFFVCVILLFLWF